MSDNKLTFKHFKDEELKKYHNIIIEADRLSVKRVEHLLNLHLDTAANRYAQYLAGEAWEEGYDLGSARESSMHTATNPYKQKEVKNEQ